MTRWPNAVLQFEDFNMAHAQPLLERYRDHHLVFNDDIQVWPSWPREVSRFTQESGVDFQIGLQEKQKS